MNECWLFTTCIFFLHIYSLTTSIFILKEVQAIMLATSAIFGCNLSVFVQQTWLREKNVWHFSAYFTEMLR